MKPKSPTKLIAMEKQLKDTENSALKLRNQIQAIKDANKPKSIIELIGSFEDACKFKKVKPSSVYNTKLDTIDEIAYKKIKFTNGVLNEGWKPKRGEYRHYPYFDVSSGFVFNNTLYADTCADTSSASRLCLKNDTLARHSGKILLKEYKDFTIEF